MNLNEKEKQELEKINELSSKSAADALSKMINKEVKVDFPGMTLNPLEKLNKINKDTLISISEITGDISGSSMISYPKHDGLLLIDMIMSQQLGTLKDMDENAKSAFNELVNIISGSYISALANYLDFKIFPAPPKFVGDFKEIKNEIMNELKGDIGNVLLIDTRLHIESEHIDGDFFIMFDNESLNKVLRLLNSK